MARFGSHGQSLPISLPGRTEAVGFVSRLKSHLAMAVGVNIQMGAIRSPKKRAC